MRTKSFILLTLILLAGRLTALNQPDTLLKPQYINLAVLIVDYETYQFEGGNFSYYSRCNECSNDSLPFIVEFYAPGDFGSIAFKIPSTLESIFYGTIIWMGTGKIFQPDSFSIESPYLLTDSIAEPGPVIYYNWNGLKITNEETPLIPQADSAWESVNRLEITNIYSEKDYRIGIFLYAPSVGVFDPSVAKWIIFLYYNDISYSFSDMKTIKKSIELYPNPCNDIINIEISSDELVSYKLEIIAFDGKIIRTFQNKGKSINVSDLKPGVYMLRYADENNSNTRLFIKD